MWVVDHLDDLESDFSVFHRVDDIYSLDGPRFFRLALRVFAYQGVMASRLAEEDMASGASSPPTRSAQESVLGRNGTRGDEHVDVSDLAWASPGLIERTEV